MQKRALTLSVAGIAAAVAVTTGVAISSSESGTTNATAGTTLAAAATPTPSQTQSAEAKKEEQAKTEEVKALLSGTTKASYFWDDGSGINGDTGAPAGGKPMQKGLFASPSWPLGTVVKVSANGRSVTGFVGDRGPGNPSHQGIMLDLDTYTFRYLLDGKTPKSKYNAGSDEGHINGLKWEVVSWGKGPGKQGNPRPFGT